MGFDCSVAADSDLPPYRFRPRPPGKGRECLKKGGKKRWHSQKMSCSMPGIELVVGANARAQPTGISADAQKSLCGFIAGRKFQAVGKHTTKVRWTQAAMIT